MRYYDRQGRVLASQYEWLKLHQDPAYVILGEYQEQGWRAVTLWSGIALGIVSVLYPDAPPLIFETFIAPPADADEPDWWYQERNMTEEAARAEHDRAVAVLHAKLVSAG